MSSADRRTEIETTLVVVSSLPQETGDRIAELKSLARFRLVARPRTVFRDVYWDLPDGRLDTQHMALRTRSTEQQMLVTLKGPGRRTGGGGVERLEIEEPWSDAALTEVLKTLEPLGLAPDNSGAAVWSENSEATLRHLGFSVVQERETERRPRDIVAAEAPQSAVIAELAIDTTSYRLGRTTLRHYEVEIEAQLDRGVASLEPIVAALLARFPSQLRIWAYSKLVTGKAVAALLEAGSLNGLRSEDGDLAPAAYDLIADYLAEQKRRRMETQEI